MRKTCLSLLPLLLALAPVVACGDSSTEEATPVEELTEGDQVKPDSADDGKYDSSALATVLDFKWSGELVSDYSWSDKSTIQDQLLYTIGHLNANKAVGRLDKLTLTVTGKSQTSDGKTLIKYDVLMPVAWGSKTNLPTSYTFRLPRDVSSAGQTKFTDSYKHDCAEYGAHDVDSGSMWYYYRPDQSGCNIADADVVKSVATVTVSSSNTTGKYPEYHKVWEDNALKVVAVFGKYEDGATTSSDAGIAAYNEFYGMVKSKLSQYSPKTIPATLPSSNPGVANPDIQFDATMPDGRTIQVNMMMVDNVSQAGSAFYTKYNTLSTRADLIQYNGHAGLGQNVRALAQHGTWVKDQYLILFMNGCDTFAYVDGSLAQARTSVNPADTSGTKFMDIVTNAMPAYFASDAEATMAMINGLLSTETPKTYEQIFKSVDSHQIVLVTGEEDNEYFPGYPGGGGGETPAEWTGLQDSGSVAKDEEKRFETPALPVGTYSFAITGTGDADLYVRVGSAPTKTLYDCRPYKAGSKETCKVNITNAAPVHVMVRGYASSSTYSLTGKKI